MIVPMPNPTVLLLLLLVQAAAVVVAQQFVASVDLDQCNPATNAQAVIGSLARDGTGDKPLSQECTASNSWQATQNASTIVLEFDEVVDISSLDVTGIQLQYAKYLSTSGDEQYQCLPAR